MDRRANLLCSMGDAESRIEKVIFLGNDLLFTVGRLDQGLNKIATRANNLFRTVSLLYQKVLSSRYVDSWILSFLPVHFPGNGHIQ